MESVIQRSKFPKDWNILPFSEAIIDATGGNSKVKKKKIQEEGKYPVIDQGQKFISGYVDDEDLLCKEELPVILFGDHTKIIKYVERPFILGADGVKVLIPNGDYDRKYLYYFLNTLRLPDNAGYSRHFKFLKEAKIPLPPKPEQKRIATILDKAYSISRKRKQAIQLTDDFLRSVFLDMFGDPVTNPKGWELKQLKDIAIKIGSGATPRGGKSAYVEEGISLIRSLNIHDDKFVHKDLAHITDEQAARLSNVEIEKDDVLLNITGASVCRCAIVDESVLPARVNQHVCIIRASELNSEYLLHALISSHYKSHLLKMGRAAGATREALTKEQINNLLIPVPPKDLQNKFAVIKNKIKSIISHEKKAINLPLFDSLSQKAFSGQL